MKTMKFLILLLSLNFFSCNAQERDCSEFKTGIFKFADSKYVDYVVERNDSIQYEKNNKNGRIIKGSVDWIDDCKYVLTFISDNQGDTTIVGKKIIVNIVSITDKGYIYEAQSGKETSTNELIKIK